MSNYPIQFQDKFVAFADVLGFKQLVSKAEGSNDATRRRPLTVWRPGEAEGPAVALAACMSALFDECRGHLLT